jgi:hypothetical protein
LKNIFIKNPIQGHKFLISTCPDGNIKTSVKTDFQVNYLTALAALS